MNIFEKLFNRRKKEIKLATLNKEDWPELIDIRPQIPQNKWSNLKPIETNSINQINFSQNHYFQQIYPKNQIIIHHTVSGPGVHGDINTWLSTTSRIATCIIIDHDGIANQLFLSKYWAHHIGLKQNYIKARGFSDWENRNLLLNRESIAVELDNWGGLILGDGTTKQFGDRYVQTQPGKYYAAYGNVVQNVNVIHYPNGYRGYYYYEKYSDKQIKTLGELILYWYKFYKIPVNYNKNMWETNNDAISGKRGIWSHTSYRLDKSDAHPQPELIEMLKTLKFLV